MSLLNSLLGPNGGNLVGQLAKQIDLDENDVQNIVGQLLPAVSRGLKRNSNSENGLTNLVDALDRGDHGRYLENPSTLSDESTVQDGNAILGHIFGSKDVSRNVAGYAAQQTGSDPSLVKKLLPIVASLAMAALSNQASARGISPNNRNDQQSGNNDTMDLISSFLDADKDGDITDDLISIAARFF